MARAVQRDPRSDAFLLDHALRAHARATPEKIALVCDGRRLSYAELDVACDRAASALRARGVSRGDRVLVALENSLELVAAFYGTLRADAVPSLLGAQVPRQRLERVVSRAEPAAVLTDRAELAAAMAAASAEPGPRASIELDLATICWTSGSLGEPKGVMLTHQNLRNSAAAIGAYLEHTAGDVILCVLPLSHTYGLVQLLVTHAFGGTVVLEKGFALPFPIVQRMVAERVTGFAGVPTIYASLLSLRGLGGHDLSSLRYLTNAAYDLPAAQIARLRELLPHVRFYAMYGQTECTRVCYLPPADAEGRPGCIGISMPNQEAWIEREDGTRAEPGEVGELVVRGAHVMRGYYGDPEATARALRPGPIPGEVVLHTHDLFRMDEQGYLTFVARKDDIIKCRGEKVSPVEVEGAIARVAGVAEVAVVGVPDAILGAAVKACIVATAGAVVSQDDVRKIVRESVGDFAVPKHIEMLAALPRTASGKVKKSEL
jgi:long-chain acyl-CoA synthetase